MRIECSPATGSVLGKHSNRIIVPKLLKIILEFPTTQQSASKD